MLRDVNVQDAPPIMTDDEEPVEHAKCDRWHSEEIHGCNGFPMVSEEGQPALGPVRISRRSFHPTGDGSLGEIKTEHQQFAVDARCTPSWILGDHAEDQIPNLLGRRPPASLLPDSGNQLPIQTETSSVPANDRFWCDDREILFPTRPDSASNHPEELIEKPETRARMSTLQRDELLTQSEILEQETSPLVKEAYQHSKPESGEAKHGQNL
jgi:hypothetical protein